MKTKYPLYLYAFYPMCGAIVYGAMTILYGALTVSGALHLTFLPMLAGTLYFIASLFTSRNIAALALEEYVAHTTLRGVFARTLYGNSTGRSDAEVDILIDSTLQAAVPHFIPKRAKHYIIWRVVQFMLFIVAIFGSVFVIATRPDAASDHALVSAMLGCLGFPCELLMMTPLWRPYQSDVTHWVAEHLGLEKKTS